MYMGDKNLKTKIEDKKTNMKQTKFQIMIESFSHHEYIFIFLCALLPSLGVGIFLFKDVFYVKESMDVFVESHTSTQYFNGLVHIQKELLQAKAEEALLKGELAQLKAELAKEINNLKVDLEYSQSYEHFLVVGLTCIVGGVIIVVIYTQ